MNTNLEQIFAQDTIQVFQNISAESLTHSYSDERTNSQGEPIPFDEITKILKGLKQDTEEWYLKEFKEPMNTYKLGERTKQVLNKFYTDSRFKQAFELLELDFKDHPHATIPWWNEIAAGELDYSLTESGINLRLGPRHSLETQLMRAGIERPVKNVSVGSIILTKDNFLVFGLRGGASYPRTYHINAGSLKIDENFKQGKSTIYYVFKENELKKEFNLTEEDLSSTTLHSRTFDRIIDQGPMYNFLLQTNLYKDSLYEKWSANPDLDKAEHDSLVFVPANPPAINQFIKTNYRGQVENRPREDNERYLLHPGALALASFSGMKPNELRELWQNKIH